MRKIQWRAALWITGAFQMSPSLGIEAIARHVPIHLHVKKLYRRFLLWQFSLLSNHIIHSILSSDGSQEYKSYNVSINHLTAKQRSWLKSSIIDMDDKHNKFFPSFSFFNKEFNPGNCIVDIFSDCFFFHPCSLNVKKYIESLKKITLRASSDPFWSIVVSDVSIKNQVATSISHIHSFNKSIVKTLHRAINITTAKAELFAICYSIN